MLLLIGLWIGFTLLASLIFHFSTRNAPPAPVPEPKPAKLITKTEAWEAPVYDYHRTANPDGAVTPIEPGDGDFPPDDPPPDS